MSAKWIGMSIVYLTFVSAHSADAQVLYGAILGSVRDQTGGGVPSAEVRLTNKGTGLVRDTKTNETGLYNFSNVLAGNYDVEVKASGFRPFAQHDISVTINTVTRIDVDLQVGQITEAVTVSSEVTPLQTDKTDVNLELSTKEITDLPLPGYRNYQSLLDLTPGATPSRFQNAVIDTPGRALTTNVNGTARSMNNTRTDGAANIFGYLRHHTVYVSPADTIETVNITTNNFDAEQGLAGGAAITVVTKSGTNALHGSAFEYHDNQHLRARNFFLRSPGKPKSIVNIFGGTLGGPIVRNKLFYFGSWESSRERLGFSNLYTLPTADQRAGDFSAYGVTIYDPLTGTPDGRGRTPFPNNVIPLNRQSPITRQMQALAPLPNQPGATVANFFNSGSQALTREQIDAKLNWNRSANHSVWGKYSLMNATVECEPSLGEAGGAGMCTGGGTGKGSTLVNMGTIGHTWTLAPTLVLDGTIGFSRLGQNVKGRDFGTNFCLDTLRIPGTNGPDPRQSGQCRFVTSGYADYGNPYSWMPAFRNDNTWAHTTNVGYIRGAHDLRFGFDLRRYQINHWQPEVGGGPLGRFNFGGGATALNGGSAPNQFNAYAQFLLGLPNGMQKSLQNFAPMSTREWQFGWYARDRWQASRNLTVTLGLRYEYYPLMTRAWSGIERYDPEINKVYIGRFGNVPDNAGTTVSKKLFTPRLGIAYRLGTKMVFRTGYGISADPDLLTALARSPYPVVIAQDFNADNSFQFYRPIEQGIPLFSGPDISSGVIDIPATVQTMFLPAGQFRRGYIQSWNATVEREMPGGIVGSVAYVGTRSIRQLADRDVNAAPVGGGNNGRPLAVRFGRTVNTNLLDGLIGSSYHALQTTINRRFSSGAFVKGAYTWSHAINENDESGSDSGGTTLTWNHPSVLSRNRATAGYNRSHVLQAGFGYELPFGTGKRWATRGIAKHVAGGWELTGILSAFNGSLFTVGSSGASLNAPSNAQTADQVKPVVEKLGGIGLNVPYYDPAAFRPVTEVRYGSTGRNILRGPGAGNLNLNASRTFPFTERVRLQFRAEAYNVSNTPHFSNPAATVSNASFNSDGTVRSLGGFMSITSAAADERQFRFAMRLQF
jgi:outer membrane receptor protein involved in Fe transport